MHKQFTRIAVFCALAVLLAGGSALADHGPYVRNFMPLTTMNVDGTAEIVAATPDGMTLVYTDSENGFIGFVDITDAENPVFDGSVPTSGEPTSVSISPCGMYALANVWVNKPEEGELPPYTNGNSDLMVIPIPTKTLVGIIPIGYHPDSLKVVDLDGQMVAVVAIENEPIVVDGDGLVTGDDEPGNPDDVSPPGLIQVVTVDVDNPAGSIVVDVTLPKTVLETAGCYFNEDPQPEFVDIHGTTAAVSLQENNGIAIVDIEHPCAPSLVRVFSLGVVSDRPADLTEDADIKFVETYPGDVLGEDYAGSRFPDAIAFSPCGTKIYSADEGELDFTGGRGWSAWKPNGDFVWDDGGLAERVAVRLSHYPEGRSENKGIEMEGMTTASFGRTTFAFVLSERGSFMAVYDIRNTGNPRLVQVLATGIAPEGVVAIPGRQLVVVSAEGSGTLSIFKGITERYYPPVTRPRLYSLNVSHPWAALSGLTWRSPNYLEALPDNALPTSIFRIHVGGPFALTYALAPVKLMGEQARYDGEGIDIDDSILAPSWAAGWWIASEGNAAYGDDDYIPNLVVQIQRNGTVLREVGLPADIDSPDGGVIRSNGFEGVAVSEDGRYLVVPIQRQYSGEPADYTRIARLDLTTIEWTGEGLRYDGEWEFFFYPLDAETTGGWIGLSELLSIGPQEYAVVERDKGIGAASTLKKIYTFSLDGLVDGDMVTKSEWLDIVDDFSPYEKVEGLAWSPESGLWVGLDNDGGEVESRVVNYGFEN